MSDSWKFRRTLPGQALPGLLRALADSLEGRAATGGAGGDFAGLPAGEFRKLVLVAERRHGALELALKAKPAGAAGPGRSQAGQGHAAKGASAEEAVRKDKYRQLKKGLQADLKALERAVQAGTLPDGEVVDSFVGRSEIMCAAPGGAGADPEMDRAGAVFLEDVRALRAAFQRRDAAALAEILGRLTRRKSACHAQFK